MRGKHLLTCRIDINPVGWKAPTAFVIRRGGKLTAGMAPATEVAAFQNALRDQLEDIAEEPITCEVWMEWEFCRRQESYVSDGGRTVTKKRQDATNLQKSAEDAIQPKIIANDSQVRHVQSTIVRQDKHVQDPWLEFRIYEWLPGQSTP